MNLLCLFVGHRLPSPSAQLRIGHEAKCFRCGELHVLTCWPEEVYVTLGSGAGSGMDQDVWVETGNWTISWQPRRYVEPGEEDKRPKDQR